MNGVLQGDYRYEVKFVARISDYDEIMFWIQSSSELFSEQYDDRNVNNIYYDTFDHQSYSDNVIGLSKRMKLRYRWYGDKDLKKTDGQFELKLKNNKLGAKKIHPISFKGELIKNSVFNHNTLRSLILRQLDSYSALIFKEYNLPILYNNYRRKYFTSSNNMIRVTVDTDYGFNVQNTPPDICTDTLLRLDIVIIEFKFSNNMRAKASQVLHGFPVRASRHSKYVSSVGMFYDT